MDTDAKLLDSGEGTKFPLFHALVDSAVTLLRATETDSVITYHAIAEAMGADVRNDNRAYRAFLRAAEIILRDDLRKVDNVRDVGYRIVKDTERRNVAKREELSSFRKLKKASATLTHVNMAPLDAKEMHLLVDEQVRVGIQLAVRHSVRRVKSLPPPEAVGSIDGRKLVAMFNEK